MANMFDDDFDIKYYTQLIAEALMNDADIYNAICEMHNSGIKLRNTITKKLPYNITKTIFQNTISNVINTIKPAISEASSDNEQSNVSHTNENTLAVSTDTIQTDTEQTQTIINEPQSETIKTNTVKTTKKPSAKKTDWSKSPDLSLRQAFARRKKINTPIEPELLAELTKRFPNFDSEKQIFTGAKNPQKNTNWSKSSDMSLRQTFSNRKKAGKALEAELLAELIKRFPNFDPEKQTFMDVKKDTDWTKSSDKFLRYHFRYHKKTGKALEPELLAELTKRFPGFDSEKQIFTGAKKNPKRNTNWSKSSDMSLRHTFTNRKKAGKPIEPELLAELTKRFPGFDSEKQTFTGAQRPTKDTDWTKSSDKSLRQAFAHRMKTGKALEPELLAELTKRFPNFDSEKQIFTGAQRPRKNTDWTKTPDMSLRQAFARRKKAGKALEPELVLELTKRFPNFDSEKQIFTGAQRPRKNTDWTKTPDMSLRQAFAHRKKAGKPIEPELLAELIKRFPGFDPETQTFTGTTNPKKNTDWSKSSDTSLRNALSNRKTKNKPIEPELHAELVKRFPNYNPETKTFVHSKYRKRITEWSKSSDTSLRNVLSNRKTKNKPIEPELLAELIKRFPNFDSKEQTFIRKKRNNKPVITTYQTKQPATTKTLIPQQEAHTTTDTVKKTPDDTQPVSTAIPTTSDTSAQQQNQTPVNVEKKIWVPLYMEDNINNRQTRLVYMHRSDKHILFSNNIGRQRYDLCLFDTTNNIAIIRQNFNKQPKFLHVVDCACGYTYKKAQHLNSIQYHPETHTLYVTGPDKNFSIDGDGAILPIKHIPKDIITIKLNDLKRTIIINNLDKMTLHNNVELGMLEHATKQDEKIQNIINTSFNPDTCTEQAEPEYVYVYQEKYLQTLNGTYNNILVNGKKILSKCIDADIKLLCNGRLMAITHNVGGIKHTEIYDSQLKSLIPNKLNKNSNQKLYIKTYSFNNNELQISLSNKSTEYINTYKISQDNRQFIIVNQKTK